jgi:hypothetical protein
MKLIIAGSRDNCNIHHVRSAIESIPKDWSITEIVSGGARGVDYLGEQWGHRCGIPVKIFPARWATYGRGAGMMRNWEMAEYADGLLAVWDGVSVGTKNMIQVMKTLGKPSIIYSSIKEIN